MSSDANVSMEFTLEELWKLILAVRTIISPVRRNNRAGTVVNDRCSIYFHPRRNASPDSQFKVASARTSCGRMSNYALVSATNKGEIIL